MCTGVSRAHPHVRADPGRKDRSRYYRTVRSRARVRCGRCGTSRARPVPAVRALSGWQLAALLCVHTSPGCKVTCKCPCMLHACTARHSTATQRFSSERASIVSIYGRSMLAMAGMSSVGDLLHKCHIPLCVYRGAHLCVSACNGSQHRCDRQACQAPPRGMLVFG